MKKFKSFLNKPYGKLITTLCGVGFIFLLWIIISLSANISLFPGPGAVFTRFGELFITSKLYEAIGGSLLRLLIAMGICLGSSLLLGLIGGLSSIFYRFFNPLIIVLRTLPTAAFIYILIVLLKPRYSLFIITSLVIFPIMYEAVASGIRNIDKGIMDSIRLEARIIHPRCLVNIIFPCARENIILGVIQSLGLGMKISIMSEVLVGTDTVKGLGRMIYHAYIDLDMPTVFAVSIYAIIIIGLLDIILHFLKKRLR